MQGSSREKRGEGLEAHRPQAPVCLLLPCSSTPSSVRPLLLSSHGLLLLPKGDEVLNPLGRSFQNNCQAKGAPNYSPPSGFTT